MKEEFTKKLDALQKSNKILRFSECNLSGKRGYLWQSVKTDDDGVMDFLCFVWNNREKIKEALK